MSVLLQFLKVGTEVIYLDRHALQPQFNGFQSVRVHRGTCESDRLCRSGRVRFLFSHLRHAEPGRNALGFLQRLGISAKVDGLFVLLWEAFPEVVIVVCFLGRVLVGVDSAFHSGGILVEVFFAIPDHHHVTCSPAVRVLRVSQQFFELRFEIFPERFLTIVP